MAGKRQKRVGTAFYCLITPLSLPLFSTLEPKGKIHAIVSSPQGKEMMFVLLGLQISPPECHEERGSWCWSDAMISPISIVNAPFTVTS